MSDEIKFVERLHADLERVAPIWGVQVRDAPIPSEGLHGPGLFRNKALWSINFQPQATEEQRAAAQAVMESFVVNDDHT